MIELEGHNQVPFQMGEHEMTILKGIDLHVEGRARWSAIIMGPFRFPARSTLMNPPGLPGPAERRPVTGSNGTDVTKAVKKQLAKIRGQRIGFRVSSPST